MTFFPACFPSDSLQAEIHVTAPDTGTTWCATAFVLSKNLGLGVLQEPAEVHITRPPPPSPPLHSSSFPNFHLLIRLPPPAIITVRAAAHRLAKPLRVP